MNLWFRNLNFWFFITCSKAQFGFLGRFVFWLNVWLVMEQTLRVWFTVFKHPATRQSIAWLGPFGLVYIAVSDLCVTSIKLLSQR